MKSAESVITLAVITVILACFSVCLAAGVSSRDLISDAEKYDNAVVTYEGEVIGEVMRRRGFCWVNTNDGENAIGLWVDSRMAKEIKLAGSYHARGDWVQVTGVFHKVCPEHGGDLDIHVESLRVVSQGQALRYSLEPQKKRAALVLFAGVICLVLIWRKYRKK